MPVAARLAPLSLFLLALLVPRVGESTSVKRLTHEELVKDAARIVHADCIDSSPEYDSTRTRIFTRVRFRVRESFKGEDDRGLELVIPGGSLGGVAQVVHGMPTFQPGEEVVLYVTVAHPKSGVRLPVGLDQGCYRIQRDREGGVHARRDMRELLLVEPGKRAETGGQEVVTLDELTAKVRAEVARQRKQEREEQEKKQQQGRKQ